MSSPQSELMNALSSLYLSGRFSDMTLVCNDQKYPCHKALLCSRSHFFDSACNGKFAESTSGEVDLSEEDEEAVEHMVHYFYHLDYLTPEESEEQPEKGTTKRKFNIHDFQDPLVATASATLTGGQNQAVNTHLPIAIPSIIPMPLPTQKPARSRSPSPRRYPRRRSSRAQGKPPYLRQTLASRVFVDGSQKPCMPNAHENSAEDSADLVLHARVYALAEKYGVQGLKTLAQEKFEILVAQHWNEADFIDAAIEVYNGTIDNDRGMRNVVLQAFRQRPELAGRRDVQALVQEVPSLATDLHRMSNGIPITS